jgi:hypothetical protein
MKTRRWLAVSLVLLVVAGVVTAYRLPELVRRVAIARLHAITERPVEIVRVDLNLLRGRASVRGFRLAERDGQPFATIERLDVTLGLPSLLLGHLRIRELAIRDSTVSVVRLPDGTFNFSDLVGRPGTGGRTVDVTVEHFALTGGKVTLEDRALPEPKTWVSDQIAIEARDLSTRGDRGSAVARSVTAGAPVAIELSNVRLYPIHVQATVTTEGLDLALARVYMPAGTTIIPERGRVSTTLTAALDAREGLRADMTVRLEDLVLVRPGGGEPVALAPSITTRVSGFAFREGALRLDQLTVEGAMSVRDPAAKGGQRFRLSDVRASVANLTWPATTPGRLDLATSIPGGGTVAVTGTLRPPPDPTELRVRLANVNLEPWAQLLPIAARITGLAQADLHMNEPLTAGMPARVQGSIAINRFGVADDRHEVLGARRIEMSGLELDWPTWGAPSGPPTPPDARGSVGRVLVSEPRGVVERDRSGGFPLTELVRPAGPVVPVASAPDSRAAGAVPAIGVEIGEIVVRNGAIVWLDRTISSTARLEVSAIDARVTGIGWPLRGPAGVRADLRPPGGGRLRLTGRVGLGPLDADVRVMAQKVELAPYGPYLPTAAHVAGAADVDLAVVVPSLTETRATARGWATLSRVDVRDGERTVMRVDRATATGVDVDWPERVAVERLALAQPWILIERDAKGELPLRALLTPRRSGVPCRAGACPPPASETAGEPIAATVAHLSVEGGGMRVVDQKVSPPFAVDLQSAVLKVEGLSTAAPKPARVELTGRLGPGSELTLRGTVGALGGPLRLDLNGELRDFAVPRTNPYLLEQVGWKTTEGRLTSKLQCRVDGDALSAKTDIRLSRLQLVRAGEHDEAQRRIGLPLGVITSLMKNKQGDINLSLPVGGRLSDPRFDYSEAIWSSVRAVAIHAITLPVSWIGRVRFTKDSRIERIDIDPVTFEAGTPTFTAEGRTQATRLTAFLDELPAVRLAVTPVVSSRDVAELKRRAAETAIDRVARQHQLSRDAAAARLFKERFPDRPAPETREAALAVLLEEADVAPTEIADLAARRLETVRETLKRAGIPGERFAERKLVQREGRDSQVDVDVLDSEAPRPSKVREVLSKLGMPRKESGRER